MNETGMMIEKLITTRTFKTNKHQLANQLKISDKDASEMLLIKVLKSRLKNEKIEDINKKIKNRDVKLLWKITYAKKDVIRDHFKSLINEQKLNDLITLNVQSNIDGKAEKDEKKEKDNRTELIIKLIPQIFNRKKTAEWVGMVLEHGKEETQAVLGQTDKKFNDKLFWTLKYIDEHRDQIDEILMMERNKKSKHEVQILDEFINSIESEEYSEGKFQELINEHYEYIDDLVGQIPMIYSPLLLVDDWEIACLKDKYKLINMIYKRKNELEKRMSQC